MEQVDVPSLRLSVGSELSQRWHAHCPFALKKLSNQVLCCGV